MTTLSEYECEYGVEAINAIRAKLANRASLNYWMTSDHGHAKATMETLRQNKSPIPYGLYVAWQWLFEEESHDCGLEECPRCFPSEEYVMCSKPGEMTVYLLAPAYPYEIATPADFHHDTTEEKA